MDVMLAISQETDLSRLDQMVKAIKDRRHSLARLTANALKVGDTIKFSDRIRPAYLKGLTATVVHCNRESVTVKCPVDSAYGRFSGVGKCRLPIALIGEKV